MSLFILSFFLNGSSVPSKRKVLGESCAQNPKFRPQHLYYLMELELESVNIVGWAWIPWMSKKNFVEFHAVHAI